jgi:hypothetical protein
MLRTFPNKMNTINECTRAYLNLEDDNSKSNNSLLIINENDAD